METHGMLDPSTLQYEQDKQQRARELAAKITMELRLTCFGSSGYRPLTPRVQYLPPEPTYMEPQKRYPEHLLNDRLRIKQAQKPQAPAK